MFTELQRAQLRAGAHVWNLELAPTAIDLCAQFADLITEANAHTNLTRISPEQMVPLHFLDSLALASVLPLTSTARVIDLGTGAGFPGIPLAIAYPQSRFLLVDGTGKKVAFLQSVIDTLELENAAAVQGRAEDLGRLPAYHGKYDMATARAVARLGELAGWMLPFVRVGGVAVAYKSRDISDEVREAEEAVQAAGGIIESVFQVELPGVDIVRKLVIMRKTSARAPMSLAASAKRRSYSVVPSPDPRRPSQRRKDIP